MWVEAVEDVPAEEPPRGVGRRNRGLRARILYCRRRFAGRQREEGVREQGDEVYANGVLNRHQRKRQVLGRTAFAVPSCDSANRVGCGKPPV